jgi:hypothetical protein
MSGEFRSVIGRGFGHTSAEKKKNSKRMKKPLIPESKTIL